MKRGAWIGAAAAALALGWCGAAAAQGGSVKSWSELPDWSGAWARVGTNVFDPATATPGGAGQPGVRARPPYNAEWEAKYVENIQKVIVDRFPDPLTYCGIPAGFPRLASLPDLYEFVVRPEQVWILTENGPNVMRIYTDGRPHPPEDEVWLTYTGDSVGRWEGDTLVFSTIAVKGEGSTIIDRTGIVLSDEARVNTRIRKLADGNLEAILTIEDPVAFTSAWTVRRTYRPMPRGTRIYDYACAENNRNPVTADGRTLTLDGSGGVLDLVK